MLDDDELNVEEWQKDISICTHVKFTVEENNHLLLSCHVNIMLFIKYS